MCMLYVKTVGYIATMYIGELYICREQTMKILIYYNNTVMDIIVVSDTII